MGLPEILISFMQRANTAVRAGSRGLAVVLLEDDTKEQFLNPYRRSREVKETDWSKDNVKLLQLVFKGGPQKVLAVRMLKKEGAADLAGTLKEISSLNADYLAYPGYTAGDKEAVMKFIHEAHEKGRKVKAVLPQCPADDEHVVNFATQSVTVRWEDTEEIETLSCARYCCRIAGILSGLPLTQSSTYFVLDEVVDASREEDPDAAVDEGKLIIIFDGEKYKIARGVTSLTTVKEPKTEDLKKIKIVEGMDVLMHDIYTTFENDYTGRVANSYDNKQMFAGAVRDYFTKMGGSILDAQAENYVEIDAAQNRIYLEEKGIDTTDMTEQELKEANTGSWMFLTGKVKFLDAAEDLRLPIYM